MRTADRVASEADPMDTAADAAPVDPSITVRPAQPYVTGFYGNARSF